MTKLFFACNSGIIGGNLEVKRIDVYRVSLRYREPFRIALGTSVKSENVVVKVTTDSEVEGWGEASPSFEITREASETVIKAMDKIAPKIIGTSPFRTEYIAELMDELVRGNTSAKAAIDMAIFDIIGKKTKKPVFTLLGGYRNKVLTDITLSIKTRGDGHEKHIPSVFPYGVTSDGGLISNVVDLSNYILMYLNRGGFEKTRIVRDEKTLGLMEEAHIKLPYQVFGGESYGYGWMITPDFHGYKLVAHGGSVLVYTAYLGYIPKKRSESRFLANASGYLLSQIGMYRYLSFWGQIPRRCLL
jgi:hypothetical protein